MAIVTPMGWGQNVGATNSAQIMRLYMGASARGLGSLTNSLSGRGGIVQRAPGFNMRLLQVGGGNMTVNVEPGICYIPGSEASTQGGYWAANDATLNVGPFTTAHASLNRIDTVYAMVRDSIFSTAFNDVRILIKDGTAGSGVAGSLAGIANTFKIGEVTVRAGATSILTSDINNNGRFFIAPGGVTSMQGDETAEAGTFGGELALAFAHLRYWDSTALLWRVCGVAKVSTTANVPNPLTNDLAWLTSNQTLQRYTGSGWEQWVSPTPRARLRQTSAQSLVNVTYNKLTFNIEDSDTLNGHSTVSNTTRYVCQRAGTYEFSGAGASDPSATGVLSTRWSLNNVAVNGSSFTMPRVASFDGICLARTISLDLAVSDFVELELYQNTGGAINSAVGTFSQSTMEVRMLAQT